MKNKQIWIAMIGASIILIGIMMIPNIASSQGPVSPELIAYEFSEEVQKTTSGLFKSDVEITSVNRLAPDLVEYTVQLTLVGTDKPVPAETYARELMFKNKNMQMLLRKKAGEKLPSEIQKITYKKSGEAWKRVD